ncbi:MAG: TonB-dependent receptor [Vicinamibacterales bacterium]
MRQLAILLCCLLVSGGVSSAQGAQQTQQTTIRGTVRDRTGAVIPGVSLTLTPVQTGTSSAAVSDSVGAYEFEGVAPGDYELRAVLSGFGSEVVPIGTQAGETQTVDVTLRIAPLAETITVTRSEEDQAAVPNAVTVIQGEDIQAFQRRVSPAEAFAGIPGVFAENRRNFSLSGGVQLAIRSPLPRFGMRGVQIVQDGIPLTMADGTTEPTNLDLGSMGRVEIIRGPSSVLYGNSAGGVVSVQTEFPAAGRLVAEPDIQFGSNGYQHQQVKLHGSAGKVSYLVNASHLETDGFRTHSAAEVRRANTVLRVALSPSTEIRGVFNLYDLPFGESAATIALDDARNNPKTVRPQALTQGWGESTTQGQGGITIEHRFAGGQVFRGTGWGLWRDVFNPIPFAVVELNRGAFGFRTEYEALTRVSTVPVTWTTGVDFSSQGDDRLESENDGVPFPGALTRPGAPVISQREEVLSIGPFVQARAVLADRWTVTGGVRFDYYDFSATDRLLADGDQSGSRGLDAVSPMAGLTYVATDQLNLYTSYATAYQTPTTVELSNTPSGIGGFNDELDPEDLSTFEFGARGVVDRWQLRFGASAYFSQLDNALVQFARPDEAIFFRNAGEASRNGIETLVEWRPVPRLAARLAYTYQDYEFTDFRAPEGDFTGNTEPGVPPHQLFLGANYETSFGLFTAAELRAIDAYPVNSSNTIENWAYQVANVRFGFNRRWNGFVIRPFLGIDNLFDERYNGSTITNSLGDRFFEPAPGREVYGGFTIRAELF